MWKNLLLSSAVYGPEVGTGSESPPANEPAAAEPTGPTAKDFLDFDPFQPESSGQEAKDLAKAAPKAPPAGKASPQGDETVPPNPEEEAEPPPPDPVKEQLAELTKVLRENARREPEKKVEVKGPSGPRFNWTLPQSVVKAVLFSEDPVEREQGLTALFNGFANSMYTEMAQEFGQQLKAIRDEIPQLARNVTTEEREQQSAREQFYSRFTALPQNPEMMQFIALNARSLAVELHKKGQEPEWNEAFIEALGQKVHKSLGMQFPAKGQQVQQPKVQGARQAKPTSFATGNGARGGEKTKAPNADIQDIWDTMAGVDSGYA